MDVLLHTEKSCKTDVETAVNLVKNVNQKLMKVLQQLYREYFFLPSAPEKGHIHGLINYINTIAKCRHLKNWLCGRCLSEFIDWRYSQSCWYFRPSFVNCCPSNLHYGSTLPPPLPCFQSTVYTDSVWLGGVLEAIFCRSLTLCIDQIQKLQNC